MILALLLLAAPQDGASPLAPAAPAASVTDEAGQPSADAERLRGRIREMRMNLLLGGDRVRAAERQAVQFYGEKRTFVDQRLDTVESDLTELRATYDVTLDRALSSDSASARAQALQEAQPLRGRISSLEDEARELAEKRNRLGALIDSVESRDHDRQRLVEQVESAERIPEAMGLPMMSIGLAPPAMAVEASSPLEDDALLDDLLRRDPAAAKKLLFESDPEGYWSRFPLRPPAGPLRAALRFPLPDLPGRR